MMTNSEYGKIRERLQEIVDTNGECIKDKRDGLCKHIKRYAGCFGAVAAIHENVKDWPLFSGNKFYPVPGGQEAYFYYDDLWIGEQLEHRLSLCRHLISKIDEILGGMMMISKDLAKYARYYLSALLSNRNELSIFDEHEGICCNLGDYLESVCDNYNSYRLDCFIYKACLDYPHYSGDEQYPIPGGHHAYRVSAEPFWQGDQLHYRLTFCRHLIKKLDDIIKGYDNG
jgi:hypothetical protein